MKIFNKISIICLSLTLLFLSIPNSLASKASRLEGKRDKIIDRTDFNGYLAMKYLEYSQYKAERNDWKNSNYFADKGLRASRDKIVNPENPEEWESRFILQTTNLKDFKNARMDLMYILKNQKSKEGYPLETANLQFLYDCWLSEESVYKKFDQVSKCKVKFFVLLDYMQNELEFEDKREEKDLKASEYLAGKQYIKEGVEYNVYFDFDSYKLNRNANQTIILLLNFLKTMNGDYQLVLEGHTDRVGKKLYNESLARKRVLTVKNKLKKNGVPEDVFAIISSGEDNPKIITKDEQREKLNRRVSIKVKTINEDFSPIPVPLD